MSISIVKSLEDLMGHHYNPRWLLRKFEDPLRPNFIWQHDKNNPTLPPVQAAISQVAQERDFYDQETEDKLHYEVERPGSSAIQKVLDKKPLDFEERVDLAVYIGTMIRRVPFHRQWALEFSQDIYPEVLDQVSQKQRELIRGIAAENQMGDEWISTRMGWLDAALEKFAAGMPKEILEQTHNPFPSEVIVAALLDMTWRIIESIGPQYFITSDNPATFFRWKGYGLGGPETELAFPLSKTIALHGSRQRANRPILYLKADQRTVREINKRLVSQASRFVFTHDKAAWLSKLLPRNDLGVMRIGW